MNRRYTMCMIVLAFVCAGTPVARSGPNSWSYRSPVSGAHFVPPASHLIFRSDNELGLTSGKVNMNVLVRGDKSGEHAGRLTVSGDRHTVIFAPDRMFLPGEQVSVHVDAGAIGIAPLGYTFTVSDIAVLDARILAGTEEAAPPAAASVANEGHSTMSLINGVAVPGDFPKFTPSINNGTADGKIFIGNWSQVGDRQYMLVLENDGTPYFYKRLPNAHTRDFKVQPTGTLTRRVYDDLNCFVEMDSQYVNIDTLRCKNGYGTDEHEVQLTADHHSFLIGLDYHQVDMSKLVSGGLTNVTVIGNTVQEQDEHHNVVFEWRSWDNYSIVDAVHENMKASTIDYVHMNSIAIDYDSNIVVSSRHLSEVTKINRKTGKIMWRFGGVHNQFRIANDAYGFTYQHDVRPVPGKPNCYTMMDNGNYHSPAFSRAIEFQLDTAAMVAIKTWEYRHRPSDYYTFYMGNVQRLPNGNTFIDWGDAPVPKATEVTSGGTVVYEANFAKAAPAYRAYRFDWKSVVKIPYLVAEASPEKITLIFNKFGDKRVKRYIVYAGLYPNPTTPIDSTTQTWIDLTNFTNNRTYYFRVTARDSSDVESAFSNEENVFVKIYPPGINQVINGDFAQGMNGWSLTNVSGGNAATSTDGTDVAVCITNGGTQPSSVQLFQTGLNLVNGKQYQFEFDGYASNTRTIDAHIEQNGGAATNYSKTGTLALSKVMQHKAYTFTMTSATDNAARVVFNLGLSTDTVHLANISVKQFVPAGVSSAPAAPSLFALNQNYPNPFNPSTTISYQLSSEHPRYAVTLRIFDMLGREVATLLNEDKSPGAYSLQWNAGDRASGMYYCILDARPASGGTPFHASKKIVVLR
jgi:hypothetical protein